MPIPTPPKKDLLKVTPPRRDTKKVGKTDQKMVYEKQIARRGPSKSTQKLSKDIRDLTEAQANDMNTVTVEEPKIEKHVKPVSKTRIFVTPAHLTQNPFSENDALRKLSYDLKKETDPKKPVKRSPKRTPANKTTGAK